MKDIILKTIKHSEQRYKTVGDWFLNDNDIIEIRTSRLSDHKREFLILVHELIECGLCQFAGITQETVDKFDKAHQEEQDEVELGDLSNAPYRRQHCFATAVERMLAAELNVVWNDYEEELLGLS
jgi:hypothetical protein